MTFVAWAACCRHPWMNEKKWELQNERTVKPTHTIGLLPSNGSEYPRRTAAAAWPVSVSTSFRVYEFKVSSHGNKSLNMVSSGKLPNPCSTTSSLRAKPCAMFAGPCQTGRVLMHIMVQNQKVAIDSIDKNFVIMRNDQRQTCALLGVTATCHFFRVTRAPRLALFWTGLAICLCSLAFAATWCSVVATWFSAVATWLLVTGTNSPREFLYLLVVGLICKFDMSSRVRSFIPNKCVLLHSVAKYSSRKIIDNSWRRPGLNLMGLCHNAELFK